jgi:hypothetical protein
VTAEWEFLTPMNPLGPDGPLTNVGAQGSGSAPGGTLATISSPAGLGWGFGDGDGGWFFPDGGAIHFRVDNIIDLRPIKRIRMQVTHTPLMGFGLDPLPAFNFGATGSVPGPVTGTFPAPTHTLITWEMRPNPPWEDFRLLVFGTGEIDQVLIDTISIPEPMTIVLAGVLASYGTFFLRRRANPLGGIRCGPTRTQDLK